ncbi:MAG: ThuA domain-containing protein [Candidatus Zipacnadales bacterium]
MRIPIVVLSFALLACVANAAPKIWLEYSDVPEALLVSNDSGTEVRGCMVEWRVKLEDVLHYTEVAAVDLPAQGELKVSDCAEWWDETRSHIFDVMLTLYGPTGHKLATNAYEGIFRALTRQGLSTEGWTASASRGANVQAAFDGNSATRWDTGGRQQAGDWFLLDMGQPHWITGVILDARGSANDYPEGVRVDVSVHGKEWTCAADVSDTAPFNRRGSLRLTFEPLGARYVRITLTKPHGDQWFWSIRELSILPELTGSQSAVLPPPVTAEGIGEETAADQIPKRTVLIFSGTRGFRHTGCSYAKPIITKLGEERRAFRAICSEDPRVINDNFLETLDCIVWNNATGSFLDNTQKAALLKFVREGGGFVGIHAATDSHYDWPEYRDLIGGWFDGHPWNEEIAITVEMPDHPACEGVPNPWRIADEIYQHRDWSRDEVCVLMRINTDLTNMDKQGIKRTDKDFGISWCKLYGQGRSFYTALGHRNEVFDDPVYQKHLLNAILWAMGDLQGSCVPHPRP